MNMVAMKTIMISYRTFPVFSQRNIINPSNKISASTRLFLAARDSASFFRILSRCAHFDLNSYAPDAYFAPHFLHIQIPEASRTTAILEQDGHLYFFFFFASISFILSRIFLPYFEPNLPALPVFFPMFSTSWMDVS